MSRATEREIWEDAKAELAATYEEQRRQEHEERMAPYFEQQQRDWEQQQARQAAIQAQQEQQRLIASLEAQARAGSYDAHQQLAAVRTLQAAESRGRNAAVNEMGAELTSAVMSADIPDEVRADLLAAPSMTQFMVKLRKAPAKVQQNVKRSMQDLAAESRAELGAA